MFKTLLLRIEDKNETWVWWKTYLKTILEYSYFELINFLFQVAFIQRKTQKVCKRNLLSCRFSYYFNAASCPYYTTPLGSCYHCKMRYKVSQNQESYIMAQGFAKCPHFIKGKCRTDSIICLLFGISRWYALLKNTLYLSVSDERSFIKLMTSGSAVKSSINCANPA